MLRKIALALVAAASLSAVALAPGVADARGGHGGGHGFHGGHGGWHGGHGFHGGRHFHGGGHGWHRGHRRGPHFYFGGPAYYGAYGAYAGCTVRRLVPTPWGMRWRWVNRCY